jgi:hypothetical protein
VVVIVTAGCIIGPDDDDEKKPKVPKVLTVSISDGDVIATRDVAVSWTGNTVAEQYRYTLDTVQSAWIDTTAALLSDLDEGVHELTIVARSDTLVSDPLTVSFEIDAIQGPGVLLSPRKVTGISYVDVYIEDAESLMAARIVIGDGGQEATFMNFIPDGSVEGGTAVVFSDMSQRGKLIIDIGFGGLPGGAAGRINVGRFILRPLIPGGEVSVDPASTVFRGIDNLPIEIKGLDMVRLAQ